MKTINEMCIANFGIVTFNLNRATSRTIATYPHSIRKKNEKVKENRRRHETC